MNEHENEKGQTDWEARINDLLDGELDAQATAELKRAASEDQVLARAIVEAFQLQQAMEQVTPERAPEGLRRRLKRIGKPQRPLYLRPAWVAAFAALPVLLTALVLLQPREPSDAEIEQAHQELAVAFAYIDEISARSSQAIGSELNHGFAKAVTQPILNSVNKQEIL